jgi:hypothetical protein
MREAPLGQPRQGHLNRFWAGAIARLSRRGRSRRAGNADVEAVGELARENTDEKLDDEPRSHGDTEVGGIRLDGGFRGISGSRKARTQPGSS